MISNAVSEEWICRNIKEDGERCSCVVTAVRGTGKSVWSRMDNRGGTFFYPMKPAPDGLCYYCRKEREGII